MLCDKLAGRRRIHGRFGLHFLSLPSVAVARGYGSRPIIEAELLGSQAGHGPISAIDQLGNRVHVLALQLEQGVKGRACRMDQVVVCSRKACLYMYM